MWTPFGIAELPLHPHPTDLDPRGGGQFYLRVDAGKFTSDAVRHSLRCRTSQAPAMGFSAVPRRNIQYQDMKMILCVPPLEHHRPVFGGPLPSERAMRRHTQPRIDGGPNARGQKPCDGDYPVPCVSASDCGECLDRGNDCFHGDYEFHREPRTGDRAIQYFDSVLTIAGADVSSPGFRRS